MRFMTLPLLHIAMRIEANGLMLSQAGSSHKFEIRQCQWGKFRKFEKILGRSHSHVVLAMKPLSRKLIFLLKKNTENSLKLDCRFFCHERSHLRTWAFAIWRLPIIKTLWFRSSSFRQTNLATRVAIRPSRTLPRNTTIFNGSFEGIFRRNYSGLKSV